MRSRLPSTAKVGSRDVDDNEGELDKLNGYIGGLADVEGIAPSNPRGDKQPSKSMPSLVCRGSSPYRRMMRCKYETDTDAWYRPAITGGSP